MRTLLRTLSGIGVSDGRAIGPVANMGSRPSRLPSAAPVVDPAADVVRLAEAIDRIAGDLRERAERSAGPVAEILRATAMIAEDPGWRAESERLIRADGIAAPAAVWRSAAGFREALAAAGGYFAERVRDLDDVRDRIIADLDGVPPPGIPDPGVPFVLAARDLAPADTAMLPTDRVLALVIEEGGPTSHTAILARAMGIPAVVACPGITLVPTGTWLAVDGESGEVSVVPPVTGPPAARPARRGPVTLDYPGHLADGTPVAVLANVGDLGTARQARSAGAAGVGLLRTEFLFGDRTTPPTFDEQVAAYTAVFDCFPGGRVVVRTLDPGSDKPLPFLPGGAEPNPALGMRGLRATWAHPDLLDTQLAAVAEAARRADADVWTMAPMIATLPEASQFADRARAQGLPRVGVMVEVPSAAVLADGLLSVVDFASVGTNDLAQYAFAADRLVGALATLNDPWQPGLLRLVKLTADAGRRHDRPVGVCGEAAADPLLALVLVGLGVTSLSADARVLAAVAAELARADLTWCTRLAEVALAAADPADAREQVRAVAAERANH